MAGVATDASAAYGPSRFECWMYSDTMTQASPMATTDFSAPGWGEIHPSGFEAELADISEEDTSLYRRAGDIIFENDTQERL